MDPSPFNRDYLQRKLCWNNGLSDTSSCVRPCCAYPLGRTHQHVADPENPLPDSPNSICSLPFLLSSLTLSFLASKLAWPTHWAASSGSSSMWGQPLELLLWSRLTRLEAPGSDAFCHNDSVHPSGSSFTTSITMVSTEYALLSHCCCSIHLLYI